MSVTVLTRATASALTTPTNVRADLGALVAGVLDPQLTRWIAQASAVAAAFCRRTFGRESVRERFEICHGRIDETCGGLLLDRAPIVSIASVKVDGETLPSDAYEADERLLYRLQDGERRCWHGRVVVVEYAAGWWLPSESGTRPDEIGPLPADVERAVIQLVGVSASAAGRDAMVKSEDVEGVGSTSWYVQGTNAALPHPEAEATLAQYRRVFLG